MFVVLNENENFWGKYSENSDLTRLVGRHSFGGRKADALHKQTFQKVDKKLHFLSHWMAENYWKMSGHSYFLPGKSAENAVLCELLIKEKIGWSLQI